MHRPLLLVFPVYCLGIMLADHLPLPLWLFFVWGSLGAGAAVWAIWRRWQYAHYWLLGAAALAGAVRMAAVAAPSDFFIANYVQEDPVRVEGIIAEVAGSRAEGKERLRTVYLVETEQVTSRNSTYRATGKMRLIVRQPAQQPFCRIGDRLTVQGKLQLPRAGSNPGDLDYRAYFLRRDIGAVMSSTEKDLAITDTAGEYAVLREMRRLRENLGNAMTSHMGKTEAAMLKGLVFGERAGLPAEVEWDFADTGLVHILSVSGFHVALITGVIYSILGFTNWENAKIITLTMLCIGAYVLLVGFSPPVLRSAIMAAVLLGAELLLRKKDGFQALLVAGFMLLLWDPRQLYDIGFQLSFGAAAGLILLSPGLMAAFRKYLPSWAAAIMAVTAAATLAVLPLLANYFQQVSLIAVLSNLVLTYPVSLLIISGMLAALLGSMWAPLAYTLNIFNNWLAGVIIKITTFFADLPGAALHLPASSWWWALGYYLLLAWIWRIYTPKFLPEFLYIWRNPRKRLLLFGLCALLACTWYGYAVSGQGLTVTFLDVGQGDAAILRTPHNHYILIDGGGGMRPDGTGYDAGEKIIVPFLRREGVRNLDLVVLSHGHEDHAGGLRTVLHYLAVEGLLASIEPCKSGQIPLRDICNAHKIPVIEPVEGQTVEIDGVLIEVVTTGDSSGKELLANESSLVVRVTYGDHRFLFTGDLEGEAELKLLKNPDKLPGTVLKVGHHGSAKGTSSAFLSVVNPSFAVISVGKDNAYGHPAPVVLQRLQIHHAQTFRTDQEGAISFFSDGHQLSVKTHIQK